MNKQSFVSGGVRTPDSLYTMVSYELPFPPEEYASRYRRVQAQMALKGVDATIVTMPRDFSWLTGTRVDFYAAESPQWLVVWEGEPVAIVRRLELATHRCCSVVKEWVEYPDEGPINPYDPVLYAADTLKRLGLAERRIGVNLRVTPVEEYARLQALLPGARLVDFRVEGVRMRRSGLELECVRRANDVNRAALAETIEALEPGWSEWDIVMHLCKGHEKRLGDEYFYSATGATVCQVGEHMLHMHAIRTPAERKKRRVARGDGIWVEPGIFVKTYVGCMIRTVWIGEPPRRVREALDAVHEALDRLVKVLAPGRTAHEVDAVARDYLTGKGFEIQHRTGYMANERWTDAGILSLTPGNPLVLEAGQVLHCPMHVFLPGIGYVGSSEQVSITATGCEVLGDLSVCPRRLYVKNP
jgi:Xaa-Pro aminopeptidase